MKKIITIIILVLCLCSCTRFNKTNDSQKECWHETNNGSNFGEKHLYLIDLEFNGEKHEYVYFHDYSGRSLSHWEGCKYCKEKEK